MKIQILTLLCSCLLSLDLFAQVKVELLSDQQEFLSDEDLPLTVRLVNRSGQTLQLGAEPDWLTFSVEAVDGAIVSHSEDVPVTGEFTLPSGKAAKKYVSLTPYFTLPQPGRYRVTAAVHIKAWKQTLFSEPKTFSIIEGSKLWTQEIGVTPKGGGVPERRNYTLLQANYLTNQIRLYLRITDAGGTSMRKVVPVGNVVSVGSPEPQIDAESRLHVIFQKGARTFEYRVYTPDGELQVRRFYEYVDKRPRLKPDGDGNISVIGGLRRTSSDDVPASESEYELVPPKK